MLFAELMVRWSWQSLLLSVCVDGWFILGCHDCSCTPGVQPHPARVQSVWLRPGEAVNQPSTTHTLHISPTPNWGWGESPASPTPPPIPHPSRQKKKQHIPDSEQGYHTYKKNRTLYRVSIPKQKINTTPQPNYLHTSPGSHAHPTLPLRLRRPEAWGCCSSWRRCPSVAGCRGWLDGFGGGPTAGPWR